MSDRKTQILETSADILRSKSFHAFGFRELAERLGVTKASIHHPFPTKDTLGIALLDFYEANGERLLESVFAENADPTAALDRVLDLSEEVLLEKRHAVCPVEAFVVDWEQLSEPLHERLRQLEEHFLEMVTDLLANARAAGSISFLGAPRDQAILVTSALQGARQMSRLEGRERFRTTLEQIKRSIGLATVSPHDGS